ncbi:MAG: erythromycin esterase family protein [Bacteroidota bacterium]|nr:erythromycin esterase family protein [Bacteroidota bacterium]
MYSCTKDEQPKLIETQKACWEIDDWTGLLTDSLMLTEEEPSIPEVDPAYVEWLSDKNNRVDIRSLTSENFEDLQCLKQYIGDRTIVQLGESSHGTKEYNLMKVRLIKFLHQEMGFEVIAFESGFFECYYSYLHLKEHDPEVFMKQSIYTIWCCEATLELFDYLNKAQHMDPPLILAGFDCQQSGSSLLSRSDELIKMIGSIDSTYAKEVAEYDNWFLNNGINDSNYLEANEDLIRTTYANLILFIDINIDEIKSNYPQKAYFPEFVKQSISSTIAYADEMRAYYQNNKKEMRQIRDSAMARNVSYLKNTLFPGKRIILWAHNVHINHDLDYNYEYGRRMGSWLYEKYSNDIYTIGLYMLRGKQNRKMLIFKSLMLYYQLNQIALKQSFIMSEKNIFY